MQHFATKANWKAIGDEASGEFEGYLAVFGNVDLVAERIVAGAFDADLKANGNRRPMLWSHDPMQPIGWMEGRPDSHGLHVRGKLLVNEIARAREVHALLRAKAVTGLSVGYNTLKERSTRDGVRELLEIEWLEGSPCVFPANPLARATEVRSATDAAQLRDLLDRIRSTKNEVEMRSALTSLQTLRGTIR